MSFWVSVITPVYNAADYLRGSVESALQLSEVREVILVEDGSPDNSLAVCEALAQEHPDRVRLFRHPNGENRGAGLSRNLAIQKARSPFIAFLDSDDLYLPNRFEQDKAILLSQPAIDGVHNALGVHFHSPAGQQWWESSNDHPPSLTRIKSDVHPDELFFNVSPLGRQGHFSIDTLTVRRQVFARIQFSALRLSQDTLFIMQLTALFRLASGNRLTPVALRGVHGHNRIQDVAGRRAAIELIFMEIFAWIKREPLTRRQRYALYEAYLRRQHSWAGIRNVLCRCPALLFNRKYTKHIPLRALFRVDPTEPIVPAFFPKWRTRTPHERPK